MKVHRIDHVSLNVQDLQAATSFFVDLGLVVQAEWEMEGEWLDHVLGLTGVKTACVALGTADGQTWIELVKYKAPSDEPEISKPKINTLGIRHLAFVVEDIDTIVDNLKKKGIELFSEVQQYQESYKLCFVRGPEGVILELAQRMT